VLGLVLFVSCIGRGHAADPPAVVIGREQVNATLWMQRAAEYRIATRQVYRLATERLAGPIAAPGSAAVE
jgi:hypothetical protein